MRVALPAAVLVVAACSASGSGDQQHGPSYSVDASVTEAGPDARGPDAGTDADGPADSGACNATIAIVAGDATSLQGATSRGGQPWVVAPIVGGSALSAPAIVAEGAGFHAVVRSANDVLKDTTYASSWSAASTIGATTSRDRPAIATLGAALHLVYSASDAKLYHGTFTAGAWDTARDPVGGPGPLQDFGPGAAGAAVSGPSLVVAFGGNDHFLYDRSYAGSWQPAHQQPGTTVYTPANPPAPAPALITLRGGAADLLAVFLKQDTQPFLYWTVRDATTKTWSTALPIDTDAASSDSPSLAPMPGGRAVMMWRGTNGMAYFNTYDPAGTPRWRQHAFLVTSTTAIAAPPTVASGVCGDDAIAAYARAGGAVQITRLKGTTWSAPESVGSLSNLGFASIATAP